MVTAEIFSFSACLYLTFTDAVPGYSQSGCGFFLGDVKMMQIFFHWVSFRANTSYPKWLSPLEELPCPMLPYSVWIIMFIYFKISEELSYLMYNIPVRTT